MDTTLTERLHALAQTWTPHESAVEPLTADPWVISSLLQKSIRRGELELAERAAYTLYQLRGASLWRRLMLIAVEDVGVGSVDALALTVASGDASFRKALGPNDAVARAVARALAAAPKDRSADYLICGANDHPSLEHDRKVFADSPRAELAEVLADEAAPLPLRALAALTILDRPMGQGGVTNLLGAYRELGVDQELLEVTRIASAKTSEPITLMVPLLWLAARSQKEAAIRCAVPETIVVHGIPLYALDKHTRLGREAIGRFARQNPVVRDRLATHVRTGQAKEAALMAAFYTDAFPTAHRFDWPGSQELEDFGRESDLLISGVRGEGIEPLLQAFREHLPDLNRIRLEVFKRSRRALSPIGGEGAS
jgi:hypothetical protein